MKHSTKPFPSHSWDLASDEAFALQRRMALAVVESGDPGPISLVAGCDIAFHRPENLAVAALVLLSFPDLEVVETKSHIAAVSFPYVPGLLSFREGPVLMELFQKCERSPDLIVFDGQGRAHPRGLGIASHMGLLLGIPSIGAAKSRLYGQPAGELGTEKGDVVDLLARDGCVIGRLVRTRKNVRPLYVSIGSGLSLDAACRLTLACTTRYRLPEPTRLADLAAAQAKRDLLGAP